MISGHTSQNSEKRVLVMWGSGCTVILTTGHKRRSTVSVKRTDHGGCNQLSSFGLLQYYKGLKTKKPTAQGLSLSTSGTSQEMLMIFMFLDARSKFGFQIVLMKSGRCFSYRQDRKKYREPAVSCNRFQSLCASPVSSRSGGQKKVPKQGPHWYREDLVTR